MLNTVWRGWVLLGAERKSHLLSKWKGPGSLSLMAWRRYWEHKTVVWIPMGSCWILEGTQPPPDKHCQLAEGPYSSAMCSHLINRTHSLHQVQENTKPFPWALGFLFISLFMSIKKLYYDANCETTLRSVVERGGGEKQQIGYYIAPLLASIRDLLQGPERNFRACFGLLEHILKRAGTGNRPVFNGCILLVLSGLCKVCGWIKVSCAAQRCGIVLLVAQLPLRTQETSPGKQISTGEIFNNPF